MPSTAANKGLSCGWAERLQLKLCKRVFSKCDVCSECTSERDRYLPLCLAVEMIYSSLLIRKNTPCKPVVDFREFSCLWSVF